MAFIFMDEKKSYPYLRALIRCGLVSAAIISAVLAVITLIALQSYSSGALALFFRESFVAVLILLGAVLSLGSLYMNTIPPPVVAYKSTAPMMYMYSGKTRTGVKLFNKMVRSGTDTEPMACLFVAGLFMILEGIILYFLWG